MGVYAIQKGSLDAGSNYSVSFVSADLIITPKPITVTADAKTKVYGSPDPAWTYRSSDTEVTFTGVLTRTMGENVGTYPIEQGSLSAGSNYTISFVAANLAITPKHITVSAEAKSKVYGEADPLFTYTSSDTGVTFTGILNRTLGENVGAYAITQGSLSAGSNYTITFVSADLTITPKPITVTAEAKTKVYGSADPTLTYISAEPGFTFSGTLTRTVGENVGIYAIGQGTLAASNNYTINFVPADLTITPRPITVTADPNTKVYGSADPALTYTASEGGLTFTGTLTRTLGENVGTYPITQGSLSAGGNYAITFVAADLTITPKPLSVTAEPKTKVYGSADPVLTYTSSDPGVTFTGALTRTVGEIVGTYPIQQGTLSAGSNYTISFISADLTISPKPITVTADAKSKVYGSADPALTYTSSDSGISFTGALTRATGENIGAYAIGQGDLTAGSNYAINFVSADLTITPKPITVTAEAKNKVYGEADPLFTYTTSDNGISFTGVLTRTLGENVGTYPITQGTLSAGNNYAIAFVPADLTITPKLITVTAEAKSKTYGEADPAWTYTSSDPGVSFTGALTRTVGENVGTYPIQRGTLSAGSNYTINFVSANLTITAKLITVTAEAKSKIFGAADPALTYTSSDAGVSFTGALSRVVGENVGTYEITQGSLSAGSSYTITFVPANLTITPKPVTVTAEAKHKVYGEADPVLTYFSSESGVTFTGSLIRMPGENAGTYEINQGSLTAGSDYRIDYVPSNLTISKADAVVTITEHTPSPSIVGQSVAVTFVVSSTAGMPTGNATVSGGAGTTCAASTAAGSCVLMFASAGPKVIGAVYAGDLNFNGAASAAVLHTVNRSDTGIVVMSSRNPSVLGQEVTFTATVTSTFGTPTGDITFTLEASTATRTLSGGTASYSTNSLSVGTHIITATYGGDSNYNGSTKSGTQMVHNPLPSISAISPISASVNAQPFTLTVTGAGFVENSVIRWNGADRITSYTDSTHLTTAIQTADVSASGLVTVTVFTPPPGGGEAAAPLTFTIGRGNTQTTLATSGAPSLWGQTVTFTATVSPVAGQGMYGPRGTRNAPLGGTVTFNDGTVGIPGCVDVSLDSSARAICMTSELTPMTHTITAVHSGDANYAGSTSQPVLQSVSQGSTTTTLASSANPIMFGQSVTFTATVALGNMTAPNLARGMPRSSGCPFVGTVQFKDGITNLGGPKTLDSNCRAVLTLSALQPGTHLITAIYNGDSNYGSSTSNPLVEVVTVRVLLPLITK